MSTVTETRHFVRFRRFERGLHVLLMLSFLGLSLTGLPLLFSDRHWAAFLARLFGGFHIAGLLHRTFAVLLIVVFLVHVASLLRRLLGGDFGLLWGPGSMVPQPRDAVEMWQSFRWFLGLGPRPRYGRWTYWEKFDYWAVFWGMGIIGGSGLLLWFPVFFARFMPGWAFNLALILHGHEALLAVGFIFSVHFFNGHLRPEKFPMDMVIFTGTLTEADLKHERPLEYQELVARGELDRLAAPPPSRRAYLVGRTIGTIAVTIGLILLALIVFSLLHDPLSLGGER